MTAAAILLFFVILPLAFLFGLLLLMTAIFQHIGARHSSAENAVNYKATYKWAAGFLMAPFISFLILGSNLHHVTFAAR